VENQQPVGATSGQETPAPPSQRWSAAPLRIRGIETVALRVPLARVFRGSKYRMDKRCTIITRITTEEGIVGESYNGDEDEEQSIILKIIHQEIGPALVGRDVFDTEGCWRAMLPSTFDILRERKLATQAIACVDSAIWDAFGKALGMPLYRLWGGYRDALPIVAIGGYYDRTSQELAEEMEYYQSQGLAGCKFKVGGATPREDAGRFRVAREAAGPKFVLMADANQGYTMREAVEFCRLIEDFDIRWFEEPCRWTNDRRAMRDVRYLTGVPVAAGQSEVSLSGARDLITEGAIDVCNFDASWAAGPTQWRRVSALAAAFDIEMAHHEEPQISAHLLAAVPHGTYVECFHPERDPLFWNLIRNRSRIQDGLYTVPSGPGFGLELDAAYIARYAV
jgi:D-galactarolactone cycloisomerase